jgi:hypothetical protein
MSYDELSDHEVLTRAAGALKKVTSLPVGSVARAIQWGVYEGYQAELTRRAVAFGLARLAKLHEDDAE